MTVNEYYLLTKVARRSIRPFRDSFALCNLVFGMASHRFRPLAGHVQDAEDFHPVGLRPIDENVGEVRRDQFAGAPNPSGPSLVRVRNQTPLPTP